MVDDSQRDAGERRSVGGTVAVPRGRFREAGDGDPLRVRKGYVDIVGGKISSGSGSQVAGSLVGWAT